MEPTQRCERVKRVGFGEPGDSPSSQITWGWKRSRALGTAKAEFSLTKDLSADALLSHMRRDPWAFTVPWEGVWRVGNFSPGSSTSVLLKPHCPMVFVGVCRRTLFCFCCSLSGWIFNYETDCLCSYVSESLAERCLKTTKPNSLQTRWLCRQRSHHIRSVL